MKNKITNITVAREMRAGRFGITRNTRVWFIRANGNTSMFDTNDILGRGNISEASVRRAKRAQVALVERHQKEATK